MVKNPLTHFDGLSETYQHAKSSSIKKKSRQNDKVNEYSGWTVPSSNYTLERIDVTLLTPSDFYTQYIATRRPVILSGLQTTPEFASLFTKWSNMYLEQKMGKERIVKIETRTQAKEAFGQGVQIEMTFGEFIKLMEKKDVHHYMTTQELGIHEETGMPEMMAASVAALSCDFPLRPKLMGNLLPQNINLWMGMAAKEGASSGLHHDYHDNLYLLLRGKKTFRVYSPADTEKMLTRGVLEKVHSNGRINYVGESTTATGADVQEEAKCRAAAAQQAAEQEMEDAEKAVEAGEAGAEERMEAAEEALDAAMEAVLDAEVDTDNDDDEDMEENEESDDYSDDDMTEEEYEAHQKKTNQTVPTHPTNFSLVDPIALGPLQQEQLKSKYPTVASSNAAFAELNAGDALYLPASWFHEVRSFGQEEGHLALNYWFHPPDNIEGTEKDAFATPYSSTVWQHEWNARHEKEE